MADKTTEKDEGARSFAVFLAELNSGAAHSEVTAELHGLLKNLRAVAELRGPKGEAKGSLTFKLNVEVHANGVARLRYDIASKSPKADREDDAFWLTKHSNLTRKNPKQQELPLRDVSAPETRGDAAADANLSSM
jgi:hypothetical protein